MPDRISLYRGSTTWQEELVGTVQGEVVELGQYSQATYPGRLLNGTSVMVGQYSQTEEVGKVADDKHTILRTSGFGQYEPVGEVDPSGEVYLGTGYRRERAGRVDPSNAGAAACLVLLLLLDTPRAGKAASPYGSVEPQQSSTPSDDRAKLAGDVAGVAGGLLGAAIASAVQHRKQSHPPAATPDAAESTAAFPPVSPPDVDGLIDRLAQLGWPREGPDSINTQLTAGRLTEDYLPMFLWQYFYLKVSAVGGVRESVRNWTELPPPPPGWFTGGWRVLPGDTEARASSAARSAPSPQPSDPAQANPHDEREAEPKRRDLPEGIPASAREVVSAGAKLVVPDVLELEVQGFLGGPEARTPTRTYNAHGYFLVLFVTLVNHAKEPQEFRRSQFMLVDVDGCLYNSQAGEAETQIAWLRNPLSGRSLQPGGAEQGLVAFDVPAQRLERIKYLRVHRGWGYESTQATYAYVVLPEPTRAAPHSHDAGVEAPEAAG